MTIDFKNADASYYYHENAAAETVRLDSSAVCGNLADAMKNATILLPPPEVQEVSLNLPGLGDKVSAEDGTR